MAAGFRIINSAGTQFAEPLANGAIPIVIDGPSGGGHYAYSGVTGTMAAALAANSTVFAMRLSPTAGSVKAYIGKLRIAFTTVVAFTTPVTAGRRLAVFRGAGAAASGGTGIASGAVVPKDSNYAASQFDVVSGGDVRIATTAALTVTGITYETEPLEIVTLTHVGAAGALYERVLEYNVFSGRPIELNPGQVLAVRNPVVFDAAGTWQAAIDVEWYEGTSYTGA